MRSIYKKTYGWCVDMQVSGTRYFRRFKLSDFDGMEADTLEAALRYRDTRKALKATPATGHPNIHESCFRVGDAYYLTLQHKRKGALIESVSIGRLEDNSKTARAAVRRSKKYKRALASLTKRKGMK